VGIAGKLHALNVRSEEDNASLIRREQRLLTSENIADVEKRSELQHPVLSRRKVTSILFLDARAVGHGTIAHV